MSSAGICNAEGCSAATRGANLMCSQHWHMVPNTLRDTINERISFCRVHHKRYSLDAEYQHLAARATDHVNGILTTRRKAAAQMDARPRGGRTG